MFRGQNQSSVWINEMKALQREFRKAASRHASLRHVVLQSLDKEGTIPPGLERMMRKAGGFDAGEMRPRLELRAMDQMTPFNWLPQICPAKIGYLHGSRQARKVFQALAQWAWLALPGTPAGKAQAFPQPRFLERWLSFVYATLDKSNGSYLENDMLCVNWSTPDGRNQEARFAPQMVERTTSQGTMIEPAYPEADKLSGVVGRWKYSALATDPFRASCVAIDILLAHPNPNGPLLISWQEGEAYQKSSAFQNADFVVDTIILGNGGRFPIKRSWCKPIPGDIPSLCPNADLPDEADHKALLDYLPKIAQRYRARHLIGADQTIHWVGQQSRLGSLCNCYPTESDNRDLGDFPSKLNPDAAEIKRPHTPRWQNWALGLEGKTWHLFQRIGGAWRCMKKVKVSKGLQAKLLTAFAEGSGFLAKIDALKLLRQTYSDGDVDPLMKIIKPELSHLRNLFRSLTSQKTKDNPMPFDKNRFGWLAKVAIGYAVQDDGARLGGEYRLRFETYDELTT